MKAITVEPRKHGTVRFEDISEPDIREGSVLIEAVTAAVCGTDLEIAEGKYGWAPPGKTRLVLGHESLGRVIDPGGSASFKEVTERFVSALLLDDVVLGGGNAKKSKKLPEGCRLGDNANAFLGGFRLWEKVGGQQRLVRSRFSRKT
jgi:threonine dehydrogenase-like Zn-dependent dehydrogenase